MLSQSKPSFTNSPSSLIRAANTFVYLRVDSSEIPFCVQSLSKTLMTLKKYWVRQRILLSINTSALESSVISFTSNRVSYPHLFKCLFPELAVARLLIFFILVIVDRLVITVAAFMIPCVVWGELKRPLHGLEGD